MKKNLLVLLSTCFCFTLYGQGWIKEYRQRTYVHCIKSYETTDGGYILISDLELKKVDRNGQISWSDALTRGAEVTVARGGYNVLDDLSVHFYNLQGKRIRTTHLQSPTDTSKGKIFTEDFELTPDGGYVVIGNTNTSTEVLQQSYPNSAQRQEGYVGRYDKSGALLSHSFFTPNDSMSVFLRHLLPGNAGNFIAWGATAPNPEPEVQAIEPDSIGALFVNINATTSIADFSIPLYTNTFLDTDIRKTYDNSYLAVVKNYGSNTFGASVVKLTDAGSVVWNVRTPNSYTSLTVNKDNTFALVDEWLKYTNDENGFYCVRISKFKDKLNPVWVNSVQVNVKDSYKFFPKHIISTSNGGYAVAGRLDFLALALPQVNRLKAADKQDDLAASILPYTFLIKTDKMGYINTSSIAGRIYKDSLKDCSFNQGDKPFAGVLVNAVSINNNKQFSAYTNQLGYYSISVDSGTYVVSTAAYTSTYEPLLCPATSAYQVEATSSSHIDEKDFVFVPQEGIRDLTIYLSGGFFPRGSAGTYYISYHNSGTQIESGSITLSHHALLSFSSSSPIAPSNYVAGEVTWNYANLQPGETRTIAVSLNVPPTLSEGILLTAKAGIYPTSGDKNPGDNTAAAQNRVVAVADQNAKFVNPQGIGEAGLIKPNTDLLYTVQFKTTGNDTTLLVQIKDTLDETLDIQHFVYWVHHILTP